MLYWHESSGSGHLMDVGIRAAKNKTLQSIIKNRFEVSHCIWSSTQLVFVLELDCPSHERWRCGLACCSPSSGLMACFCVTNIYLYFHLYWKKNRDVTVSCLTKIWYTLDIKAVPVKHTHTHTQTLRCSGNGFHLHSEVSGVWRGWFSSWYNLTWSLPVSLPPSLSLWLHPSFNTHLWMKFSRIMGMITEERPTAILLVCSSLYIFSSVLYIRLQTGENW